MTKVLVIGSGGREHALGYNMSLSDDVTEVLYAPGNAGTAIENKGKNVAIGHSWKDFPKLSDIIEKEDIDLVIVGPEDPLNEGLVDYLGSRGHHNVFGPTQAATKIEADKFFSYDIMNYLGIPQAKSIKCHSTDDAIEAINWLTTENGIVIKARGLTAGKGVSVCGSKEEALEEIQNHSQKYGPEVLIAERLFGEEFSIFGFSDGNTVSPLELSLQDHKPLLNGDKGPNTGGMGAYGPAPIAPLDMIRHVSDNIMNPVVKRMKGIGHEYKGFLYAGMIMTANGPEVIEFNARFGDPECQPAMMILKDSLYVPLSLALEGRLNEVDIGFKPGATCCVVLASDGYPGKYSKGLPISGIDEANAIEGVKVFHAGTKYPDNQVLTNGGRVLGITAYAKEGIQEAQRLAYQGANEILSRTPGVFTYRTDIADKAIRRLK